MQYDYAAKIQALLANADDRSIPEEARALYRAKAEAIMVKYRIAEEEALAADAGAIVPVARDIVLYRPGALGHWYGQVFRSIATHTGLRLVTHWSGEDGAYVATVVGYEGDIRYAEFLWTAALLMFSTRIDPRWDDTLPEAENVWRLRNAGIERRVIADRAWGNGFDAAARSKVQRIYTRECARRGEEARAAGLGHNTAVYREAYARSFAETLARRLRDARDAVDAVHGLPALYGRAERVDEAFYTMFPAMRPSDVPYVPTPAAPCDKCKKAKSGHCREHPALRWTASDEARYQRMHGSPSARAGEASGAHAAEGVLITRGHERATRVEGSDPQAIDG